MAFDLDKALVFWRRPFVYHSSFFKEDVDELEQHLRDHIEHLKKEGFTEKEAFDRALSEMGDRSHMEQEYKKVFWGKIKRKGAIMGTIISEMNRWKSYWKIAWRNLIKN